MKPQFRHQAQQGKPQRPNEGHPALQPKQPQIVLPGPSSAKPPALDAIAPAPDEQLPEPERLPQPTTEAPHAMKAHGVMWVPTIGPVPGGYVFAEYLIEFDDAMNPRLAEIELVHPTDRANACDRLRREVGKQIMSSGSWRQ